MSTVLSTTAPLSATEARALTDRIRDSVESLWSLLLEAYEREAWRALGYARWQDYVETEFSRTRQWSYQLLDQGRVVRALQEAAATNAFDISISEARDIKPVLELVVEDVRTRVDAGEEPAAAVRAVVEEKREERKEAAPPAPRSEPTPTPPAAPQVAPADEDEHDAPDMVAELEHAHAEIARLESEVESLSKPDLAAEVRRLTAKYAQLEGRLRQEVTNGNTARSQAKRDGDLLKKIREALKVEKNGEILPKLREVLG